jgi:hypothetical protein
MSPNEGALGSEIFSLPEFKTLPGWWASDRPASDDSDRPARAAIGAASSSLHAAPLSSVVSCFVAGKTVSFNSSEVIRIQRYHGRIIIHIQFSNLFSKMWTFFRIFFLPGTLGPISSPLLAFVEKLHEMAWEQRRRHTKPKAWHGTSEERVGWIMR